MSHFVITFVGYQERRRNLPEYLEYNENNLSQWGNGDEFGQPWLTCNSGASCCTQNEMREVGSLQEGAKWSGRSKSSFRAEFNTVRTSTEGFILVAINYSHNLSLPIPTNVEFSFYMLSDHVVTAVPDFTAFKIIDATLSSHFWFVLVLLLLLWRACVLYLWRAFMRSLSGKPRADGRKWNVYCHWQQ